MVLLGVFLWAGVMLNLLLPTDMIHPPPLLDFPFPSAEMLKKLPQVTSSQTNRSLDISKFTVSMLKIFEKNLKAAGVAPKHESSAQGLLLHGYPSEDAMHYEKSAMIISKASSNLVHTSCTRYGLPTAECASFISILNFRDSEFGRECATLERFSCRAAKSRYRTYDGSCNNPMRSSWGKSMTGYKRLLYPRYADGISEPRHAANNRPLPSARLLSTKLANNLDRPDETKTMALTVWSQFVYHDMTHTPIRKMIHIDQPIRCCDLSGFPLAPRYLHPNCYPISVPSDDPFFAKDRLTCMEYTRSVTTYRGDCTFGASEQMNQASHFLDGSHIYGTNSREAAYLREKTSGLLKTATFNDEEFPPLITEVEEKCMLEGDSKICFNTGDVRGNMHPWLGGMHVLWVREHNRIARTLAALNPSWSSERLYQEARRITVAELQHITYKYWLPAITGKSFDEMYKGYDDIGYNSDVDPGIANSFATATSHFIHSLLDEDIQLEDEQGAKTEYKIGKKYFNPSIIAEKNILQNMMRGMVRQKSQGLDFNYDNDVWNSWLGGLDALAVDIQRGRDHGLPGYVQFRSLCGLPEVTQFQHFADVIPQEIVDKLSAIYKHPNDVDLVIGGMAEDPQPGTLMGPTFTCLIKEQFWRTRAGDRFFYTHVDEVGGFSKRHLAEIKRVTLARIMCDNIPSIQRVQRDVFSVPSDSNPLVPCDEIKKMNLDMWQDPAQQPDILVRTQQNVNKWIKNKVTK